MKSFNPDNLKRVRIERLKTKDEKLMNYIDKGAFAQFMKENMWLDLLAEMERNGLVKMKTSVGDDGVTKYSIQLIVYNEK